MDMELDNRLRQNVIRVATATGVAFSTMSVLSLLVDDPEQYIDALMMVPFALMFFGIVGIHYLQQDSAPRSETIGYKVLAITIATMVITQPLLVFDISALSWIAFPFAFLGFLGGTILFSYGTYRAHVLPGWCAVSLGLSEILTMGAGLALSPISPLSDFGDYSGACVHGVIWFGVAYALQELTASPTSPLEQSVASSA
jgi:hypothetical protein